MILNGINSYAPILTALIIAATAIAAIVQLRHMRASNLINAMFAVSEKMNDSRAMTARRRLNDHLATLVDDPGFREFVARQYLGKATPDTPELWIEIWQSANVVGNQF